MRRIPIRLRVAGAFAVSMAVVLTAIGWLLYARVGSHLSVAIDNNLRLRAQDLTALVREPGAPLAAASGGPLVETGESYAQLVDASGRIIDATPPLHRTRLLSAGELRTAERTPLFADRGPVPGLDEPSRLLATPVVSKRRRLVLVVGTTREGRAEALSGLRTELLIAGPIALLLATIAGYLLAGLSLGPVESMRRRASEISAETLDERLPVPETGDELQRLAETLNEMLARLGGAIERERDFVADAGHELRTPLALLKTELELALRHAESTEELRETLRLSVVEVDRLTQLAEDLLLIARFDRGTLPLRVELSDASDLLGSVARRFEWRAQEDGRAVSTDVSDCEVLGDRLRLEQALGNLVDNALRHGEGEVRLSALAANGWLELHVTDEGNGFPPELLERAFERFTRGDQARARGGAGLGLSIVQVVAEAHGGSAHVGPRAGGGADVWVVLPGPQPVEADPGA